MPTIDGKRAARTKDDPPPIIRTTPSDEKPADAFADDDADDSTPAPPRASVDLDELPIELIGLIDGFIESLTAHVHPTPANIDNLSQRFQDFYATASQHIATHLAALATRQSRPVPPPGPTRASTASLLRAKAASIGRDRSKSAASQAQAQAPPPPPSAETTTTSSPAPREPPTVTPPAAADELAARRRARRAQEHKRALLEEAVERRLCEGLYERIYRHRTTQDEAQDQKLRSKTAALDVVGIGPKDLGIDLGSGGAGAATAVEEVRAALGPARTELRRMGQSHYPLGKLNRLKAAHKALVDMLEHYHPSASADEILPLLIYTLITQPPADLNVVSDLHFVRRFRWEHKNEGEAAYCLTNLEAAIAFCETVDLSTLRADEKPSGPAKQQQQQQQQEQNDGGPSSTEPFPTFPPAYATTPATPSAPEVSPGQATGTLTSATTTTTTLTVGPKLSSSSSSALPSPTTPTGLRAAVQLRNRRLSDLVNTPAAQAISNASDAVLNTFNAADQGLKTIGNSLEGSYRLFLGRMKGEAAAAAAVTTGDGTTDTASTPILPKTLDDARKLVTTPPSVASEDDDDRQSVTSIRAAAAAAPPPSTRRRDTDKMLLLVGGRRAAGVGGGAHSAASREHSADSARSRRSAAEQEQDTTTSTVAAPPPPPPLLDSDRSLSSSFNPMSRLSGFGSLRSFGRTASGSTPAPTPGTDLATAFPDLAGALPPKTASPVPAPAPPPSVAPPIKRFMELHNPGDLRLGEVMELLRDYRRLAGALKEMGAFK